MNSPRIGVRLSKLRATLCGWQNYRCATCGKEVLNPSWSDDNRRASLIKYDRTQNHSKDNSVICCGICAANQGNYPSLLDFYEHINSGDKPAPKVQPVYPETISYLNWHLAEYCSWLGIPFVPFSSKSGFKHVPPDLEKLNKIISSQMSKLLLYYDNRSTRQELWFTQKTKQFFMERQNYRCCYCGDHFDESNRLKWSTWEHVIDLKHGGQNRACNLVIACSFCNNTRDRMKLSAEDFYYWVIEHRDEYQQKYERMIHKINTENRSRYKSGYVLTRVSNSPK